MKTTKFILALIAISFSVNILFAGNPKKGENDKLANDMLSKLCKDIVLTDSQKIVIVQKLNNFLQNRQDANVKSNDKEKAQYKKESYEMYKIALDSLLTNEQKITLENKRIERKHKNINAQ